MNYCSNITLSLWLFIVFDRKIQSLVQMVTVLGYGFIQQQQLHCIYPIYQQRRNLTIFYINHLFGLFCTQQHCWNPPTKSNYLRHCSLSIPPYKLLNSLCTAHIGWQDITILSNKFTCLTEHLINLGWEFRTAVKMYRLTVTKSEQLQHSRTANCCTTQEVLRQKILSL